MSGAGFPRPPLLQPFVWAILPSFFALSGFLVAGSLIRSKTTIEFVLLRAMRIVPALFVETIFAAFILGPLVTELPPGSYFTNPEFFSYALNILGDVHYSLPGVFTHNPIRGMVNQQLWTIPAELLCYLTLVVVSVFGLIRIGAAIPVLTITAIAALSAAAYVSPETIHRWSAGYSAVRVNTLLLSFLVGVTIFNWREKFPLNKWLFALSVVLTYVLLYDGAYQYLAAIPVAYATVFVGLTDFRKSFITATGDYSYGVYLYGFPIQQSIAYVFPGNRLFILNFAIALPISLGLAALSWHLVESKVLAHRREVIAATQRTLERITIYLLRAALVSLSRRREYDGSLTKPSLPIVRDRP
jgi:peptidoglycan/LPS O-acetylase OafA/YrhL